MFRPRPWIAKAMKNAVGKSDRYYREVVETPATEKYHTRYRPQRKQVTRVARRVRREFHAREVNEDKSSYRVIGAILGKCQKTVTCMPFHRIMLTASSYMYRIFCQRLCILVKRIGTAQLTFSVLRKWCCKSFLSAQLQLLRLRSII